MMNGMGFGAMGMGLGWLFWALVVGLVIWLVTRYLNGGVQTGTEPQQLSALDILKARYASGELTRQEFDRMKKDVV